MCFHVKEAACGHLRQDVYLCMSACESVGRPVSSPHPPPGGTCAYTLCGGVFVGVEEGRQICICKRHHPSEGVSVSVCTHSCTCTLPLPPPANPHSTGTCCQALSLPHWKEEGRGEKAQGHGLQGVDRPQSPTGSKGLQLGSTSPGLGTGAGGEGLWQIHFYFPAH